LKRYLKQRIARALKSGSAATVGTVAPAGERT
jgi:hypothetical protein